MGMLISYNNDPILYHVKYMIEFIAFYILSETFFIFRSNTGEFFVIDMYVYDVE